MKASVKFWTATGAVLVAWMGTELAQQEPNGHARTARANARHAPATPTTAIRMPAPVPAANETLPQRRDSAPEATRDSLDFDAASAVREAIVSSPLQQLQLAFIDSGDVELLRIYARSIDEIVTMDEASRSIANSPLLRFQSEVIGRSDDELLEQYAR